MGFELTENQQKIVDHIHGNLLVAAGAGSGKTAVLTQHIAKRVLDEDNPVDIDKMLVLTYTKAAAAEMKSRIRGQLEEKLESDPDNTEIRRQLTLLPTALICTIDSFCQKVLKEQFYRIDLDPGFKVADETELELIKNDIISEYFEELYEQRDIDFIKIVDKFGKVKGDDEIVKVVKNIIKLACAYADPEEWILKTIEKGDSPDWLYHVLDRLKIQFNGYYEKYSSLLKRAEIMGFPQTSIDVLSTDLDYLKAVADYDGQSYDELSGLFSAITFKTFRKPKADKCGRNVTEQTIETFAALRDSVKKNIQKMQKSIAEYSEAIIADEEAQLQEDVVRLFKLALEVYTRFQDAKKAENQVDFADMEQKTWKLFIKDGQPTDVAIEYSERFAEILIDEYQDCNKVQEDILNAIAKKESPNRFMVGDVKQSIYGFRKARPDIFVDKYKGYKSGQNPDNRLVELRENFRSSAGVINGINNIFSHMMIREMGDIDYETEGCLKPDPNKKRGDGPDIEVDILDPEINPEAEHFLSDYSDIEKEAYMVAEKIHDMVSNKTQILDKDSGEFRDMRYGDTAILLRSVGKNASFFLEALKAYGIPAYTESEKGYYDSLEVANTLDFLSVLDNPYQDVKLLGVLKSGYCSFTADELAAIRILGRSNELSWLYDELVLFASLDQEEIVKYSVNSDTVYKANRFITLYNSLRERTAFLSISELLTELLDETGFMYYSLALPGGKKRVQNLRMLQVKAENYEQTRYRGIFQFLRYIDQLKEYEMDIDTPSLSADDNSVVIMTIHKSKGLEFPVCFVSATGKGFNKMESRNKIQQDDLYGIGLDIVNERFKYRLPSYKKSCIISRKELTQKTEEQRLLYVAMTRARDRLIITGTMKNPRDYFVKASAAIQADNKLSLADVSEADNYLDWISSALVQEELLSTDNTSSVLAYVDEMNLKQDAYHIKVVLKNLSELNEPETAELIKAKVSQVPISEELNSILDRSYPYEAEKGLHAIFTVSELKKTAYVEPDGEKPIVGYNASNKAGKLTGAERGNAYHHFMEALNFGSFDGLETKAMKAEAEKALDKSFENRVLNEAERNTISPYDIVKLMDSDIGRRMIKADLEGKLLREQEFVYAAYPDEISELNATSGIDEQILIQGIIDAVFYENGKWIIIDYKTDNLASDEDFINRYKIQLKYYKTAWEDIRNASETGEEVTEMYLYSFRLGRFIEVSL